MVMVMAMETVWGSWGLVAVLMVTFLVVRVFWVLQNTGRPLSPQPGVKRRPLRTLIVLGSGKWTIPVFNLVGVYMGVFWMMDFQKSVASVIGRVLGGAYSGGHTAEMMSLVGAMNLQWYAPRHYIAGMTDNMSLSRAERIEAQLLKDAQFPDQILCNGPGTCLPICVAGFLLKVVGWRWVVVVYVESIARVKKLSLTGLLLYKLRLADQFFVQWPDLKTKYPQANYVGRLM